VNAASLGKELEQLNANEQEENDRLKTYLTEQRKEIKSSLNADIEHDGERIWAIAMIRRIGVIAELAYLQGEKDIKCCASTLNKLPDHRRDSAEQNVVSFCFV
jgi:hypothetical protein